MSESLKGQSKAFNCSNCNNCNFTVVKQITTEMGVSTSNILKPLGPSRSQGAMEAAAASRAAVRSRLSYVGIL